MKKLIAFFLMLFFIACSNSNFQDRKKDKNLVSLQNFWTLVVIPDAQHYSQNRFKAPIDHMYKGFQWIKDNRDRLNIQFVQGLGDITESWNNHYEWTNAKRAWNILEGTVGYMPIMGNHDDPRTFNNYFPTSQFRGHAHYREDFGGIENNYCELTLLGKEYLFLHIEPYDEYSQYRTEGLAWAKKVLDKFPNKRVILATHDIWHTEVIKKNLLEVYDNIKLANGGHSCSREVYYKTRKSNNFVVDYQCDHIEDFKIRYYTFYENDRVEYFTYSPVSNKFEIDDSSQGYFYIQN